MEIDLINENKKDSFLHWVLMHSISKHKTIYDIQEQENYNVNKVEVKLSINGIEHDLKPVLEELENRMNKQLKEIDNLIKEKAASMLRSHFDHKFDQLSQRVDELKEIFDEEINKICL